MQCSKEDLKISSLLKSKEVSHLGLNECEAWTIPPYGKVVADVMSNVTSNLMQSLTDGVRRQSEGKKLNFVLYIIVEIQLNLEF